MTAVRRTAAVESRDAAEMAPRSTSEGQSAAAAVDPAIAILTGAKDPHYAIPLANALARHPWRLQVVACDEFSRSEGLQHERIAVLPLHGNTDPRQPAYRKALRIAKMYLGLTAFAARTDASVFHVLWPNKFDLFDRVVLTAYYKLLGKTLIHTAHNVDGDARDGRTGLIRRLSLRLMYGMTDHFFVHTEKMKEELERQFEIDPRRITVIPFGMNTVAPVSDVTRVEARRRLGIDAREKLALFFGNIAPYKGLEYLVRAVALMDRAPVADVKVLIAGNVKGARAVPYWQEILGLIDDCGVRDRVRTDIRFVPEEEVELFFKAADVSVLPYREIYQTGLLCLSHRYGVPIVATDVGSMKSELIEGQTGFICRASDAADLARALEAFFRSELLGSARARHELARYAEEKYSWAPIAATISATYRCVMSDPRS